MSMFGHKAACLSNFSCFTTTHTSGLHCVLMEKSFGRQQGVVVFSGLWGLKSFVAVTTVKTTLNTSGNTNGDMTIFVHPHAYFAMNNSLFSALTQVR